MSIPPADRNPSHWFVPSMQWLGEREHSVSVAKNTWGEGGRVGILAVREGAVLQARMPKL